MATTNIVADFDAWQTELFATLVKATKASNAIPVSDVSFYRTLDPSFTSDMNEASDVTLDLCNSLLQQAGGSLERLRDHEDVSDRFDIVVDVVDNMLEKVVRSQTCFFYKRCNLLFFLSYLAMYTRLVQD